MTRSLFIIRYRFGNKLHAMPVYADSRPHALQMFHQRMGTHGAEGYRVQGYREIPEPEIDFRLHREFIRKLSRPEQLAFWKDRGERQVASQGYESKQVLREKGNLAHEYSHC